MKKFLRNDAYEILTDNGFEDFEGLLVQENELNRVEFEEVSIEATSDHRFLTDDGKWVFVNEMTNSISVKNGGHFIKSNKIGVEKVYDPVNVKSSSYLSNGIISHNCSMVYIDECVGAETKVTIRNKRTGEIQTIEISRLLEIGKS